MTYDEIIQELERRESCSTWNVATIPTILLDQTINLLKSQRAEIESQREYLNVDNLKAEAIKEFAEQVEMAFYYEFDELIPSIMADKIDDLVKEMVGDKDV